MDKTFDQENDVNYRYVHFNSDSQFNVLDFVQLGYRKSEPSFSEGPWIRNHYILHFVARGCGTYEVNHKLYTVKAGQCFLMEPKQVVYFASDSDEPWEYYWFGFKGPQALTYVRKAGFSISNPVRNIVDTTYVFEEFSRIDALQNESHNLLAYNALLNNIMHRLIESASMSFVDNNPQHLSQYDMSAEEYVSRTLEMITQSYAGNISIEGMAQRLSLNHAYLCKIFKRVTGTTIKKYLIDYRLSQACAMMRNTNKSISDIALANGFNDPLYFSRCFRKQYGTSPTSYRQVHIQSDEGNQTDMEK